MSEETNYCSVSFLKSTTQCPLKTVTVSEAAFQEFERLKGNYEQEVVCRDKAEKYAAKVSICISRGCSH